MQMVEKQTPRAFKGYAYNKQSHDPRLMCGHSVPSEFRLCAIFLEHFIHANI